ncbi:MAG: GMP synthase, partial [Saprospiraceae bacterium]
PGDPLEFEGGWEKEYYSLMDQIWERNASGVHKKYVFFICHSFQMICDHLKVGKVKLRDKESFGIVPVDKTEAGEKEPLFMELKDPFYGADFRKYEVIFPDQDKLNELGAVITAIEKTEEESTAKKALMAIRFSSAWFGTQFHPEAHPDGMLMYLRRRDKKDMILRTYGSNTYEEMMHNAIHPDRLTITRDHILPGFLSDAIDHIMEHSDVQPLVVNG